MDRPKDVHAPTLRLDNFAPTVLLMQASGGHGALSHGCRMSDRRHESALTGE